MAKKQLVSLLITEAQISIATELGNGNLSEGIRLALESKREEAQESLEQHHNVMMTSIYEAVHPDALGLEPGSYGYKRQINAYNTAVDAISGRVRALTTVTSTKLLDEETRKVSRNNAYTNSYWDDVADYLMETEQEMEQQAKQKAKDEVKAARIEQLKEARSKKVLVVRPIPVEDTTKADAVIRAILNHVPVEFNNGDFNDFEGMTVRELIELELAEVQAGVYIKHRAKGPVSILLSSCGVRVQDESTLMFGRSIPFFVQQLAKVTTEKNAAKVFQSVPNLEANEMPTSMYHHRTRTISIPLSYALGVN